MFCVFAADGAAAAAASAVDASVSVAVAAARFSYQQQQQQICTQIFDVCECTLLFAVRCPLVSLGLDWQFINSNLLLSVAYANKVNIDSHASAYHSQQTENMRVH